MKYIIIFLVLLLSSFIVKSEIVREGNTFIEVETKDKVTPYTYVDKKGNVYPIYQTKNGKYYIIKVSKKTGKEYKKYINRELFL